MLDSVKSISLLIDFDEFRTPVAWSG